MNYERAHMSVYLSHQQRLTQRDLFAVQALHRGNMGRLRATTELSYRADFLNSKWQKTMRRAWSRWDEFVAELQSKQNQKSDTVQWWRCRMLKHVCVRWKQFARVSGLAAAVDYQSETESVGEINSEVTAPQEESTVAGGDELRKPLTGESLQCYLSTLSP